MLDAEIVLESTPLIYNSKKYIYEINDRTINLYNKITKKLVFSTNEPIFIKEVLPDEFIVVFKNQEEYYFTLQHIKENDVIYQKEYKSEIKEGEITQKEDYYIIPFSNEKTTIYNIKNHNAKQILKRKVKHLSTIRR